MLFGVFAFGLIAIHASGSVLHSNNPDYLVGMHREERSLLSFPPSSLLQMTVGVTLAEKLENNNGVIVLGFQQNANLPNESQALLFPSQVVAARQMSVYSHLKEVFTRYGFNGEECLKKMVCQVAETPLFGGILEEVVSFVLTPSIHEGATSDEVFGSSETHSDFRQSEVLGRNGGNCTHAFPLCERTPLDLVSTFTYL